MAVTVDRLSSFGDDSLPRRRMSKRSPRVMSRLSRRHIIHRSSHRSATSCILSVVHHISRSCILSTMRHISCILSTMRHIRSYILSIVHHTTTSHPMRPRISASHQLYIKLHIMDNQITQYITKKPFF